ncbi:MAG: hypothetical protein RR672_10480, partial [Raoultibacter sp.]
MENFQTIEEAESALNPNQYISINSDGTFRVLDKDTEGKWIAACMYAYAKAGIPFPVDRYKLEEIPPDATTVSDTSAFLPPQTTTEPSSDSESNAAQEQSEQESNPPAEENLDVSLQEVQNNGRNSKTAKVAIVISIVVILFIIVFSLFGLNNNPSPTNTSSSAEQSQERVSKTELNNMIKRSELRDLSLYSEDSAKKFKAALDEAKVISSKDDASGSEIEKA